MVGIIYYLLVTVMFFCFLYLIKLKRLHKSGSRDDEKDFIYFIFLTGINVTGDKPERSGFKSLYV